MNEAINYHDLRKSMCQLDPVTYEYPNAPAYLLFDAQFRAIYPISFSASTTLTQPG
jgi:3-oxosteroid 1-dehydrogenase